MFHRRSYNRLKARAEKKPIKLRGCYSSHSPSKKPIQKEDGTLLRMLNAMEDGVCIINSLHEIEYHNPTIEKEYGPGKGRKCYEYFHDRSEICPWCKNQEVFQGNSVRWEWTSIKKNKTYDLFDTPLINDDGTISKLEIFHDVTDRKRVEEALRVAEKKYRDIVENTLEGIFQSTVEGRYLMANPALSRMLGYDSPQQLMNTITDIPNQLYVNPSDRVRIQRLLEEKGSVKGLETQLFRRDGSLIWFNFSIRAVRNEMNKILYYEGVCEETTQRKQAEEALRESEKMLQQLSFKLMTAQEAERRRVSRELHDELGQSLALLKCRIGLIERSMPPGQIPIREECRDTLQYLDQVIEEVRRLALDLSPSMLEDLGLPDTLKWLLDSFTKSHNIQVLRDMEDLDRCFSLERETFIYRIFQEALTNIARHSQASRVRVEVLKKESRVHFSIEDDGEGFDVEKIRGLKALGGGMGLTTMSQRCRMLEGNLNVWSQPGKGTRISFIIPENVESIPYGNLRHYSR